MPLGSQTCAAEEENVSSPGRCQYHGHLIGDLFPLECRGKKEKEFQGCGGRFKNYVTDHAVFVLHRFLQAGFRKINMQSIACQPFFGCPGTRLPFVFPVRFGACPRRTPLWRPKPSAEFNTKVAIPPPAPRAEGLQPRLRVSGRLGRQSFSRRGQAPERLLNGYKIIARSCT